MIQKDPHRLDEALAYFKKAEMNAPHQLIYKFRKAHTMMLLGDFSGALKELKMLAGQNVSECNVYYLMGRIYQQMGDKKQAVQCFTLAHDRLSNKASNVLKDAIGNFIQFEHLEKVGESTEISPEDLKIFDS